MTKQKNEASKKAQILKNPDFLWSMSLAPKINESAHWFQMLPAAFFTAVVILITRMHSYTRPMEQFFWSGGENQLSDFFSYFKMIAICICAALALVFICYRVFCQTLSIKRSYAYIPMLIYSVFVLLSYLLSDYKDFAWLGWNDRFEGTIVLLSYMIMLFYIINSVNSEKEVKWIIYPLAVASALLSLLGLSQAIGKDFFQSVLGQKLLVPNTMTQSGERTWDLIDKAHAAGKEFLAFTFQNKEIYQTVYNINYVSFYLTLLIPLFGMIFIYSISRGKEYAIWKKVLWGLLFALSIFNLIGSASSGGLLGMAIVVLVGIIVLNKRIITWWKPVVGLIILTLIVGGITFERWVPEFFGAVNGVVGKNVLEYNKESKGSSKTTDNKKAPGTPEGQVNTKEMPLHYIDYMETKGSNIVISISGNEVTFQTFPKDPASIKINDKRGKELGLVPTGTSPIYKVDDKRFEAITIRPAKDEAGNNYIIIATDGNQWPFRLTDDGVKYYTSLGQVVDLHKVEAIGFKNNQAFGSGRGYIWSRTIPMLKDTLFVGHGADTYCAYFPHDDYVGKYNAKWQLNMIVDKPHNMYLGIMVNTGVISLFALFALWIMYIIQSVRLYWKENFDQFNTYVGAGIFLGICGFLVAGFVNDSTVSVTPMFYGLFGTGIAINMMLKRSSTE